MDLTPVILPDFYSDENRQELFVHHFTTDSPHVRHNLILQQNLICILLEGTKEVFSTRHPVKIDNSEILIMRSGSSIMIHSAATGSRKLESILLFFSNELLREFCIKHKFNFDGEGNQGPFVLPVKKDDFIKNFETSMRLLEGADYSALQKLKLEELFVYLALKNRSTQFDTFIRNALSTGTHEKLRQVVAGNCANGLRIEELAFLSDMSVSTFKRHFHKAFGCSPKKYLTDKKMERASELLRVNYRPSDIYKSLHYQNLSSFSTEFKKHFGVSPRQYQSKMRVAVKM